MNKNIFAGGYTINPEEDSLSQRNRMGPGYQRDWSLREVLMLSEDGENWIKIGDMKYARHNHGATVVSGEIAKYCK